MSEFAESRPVRRLLPDQADTTVFDQLQELDPSATADGDRPRVLMNFVSSTDGRATIDGRSGPLGSRTDMEMLQRLRTRVDAVMIGAGTMRAERYGRMVSDEQLRSEREDAGLAADPLGVLVSGTLDLPWDAPLFTDGNGKVVIFTTSDDEVPGTATEVEVVREESGLDLAASLDWLGRERGIRTLMCEGGPRLHGAMQAAGVVDELYLTLAPKLAGSEERSILAGDLPDPIGLEISWVLEGEGDLFMRYLVKH